MDWTRGRTIGRGSTATVYIADRSNELFAVKSAELNRSDLLKREMGILSTLNCPQIVQYKGCDVTFENGVHLFNLFMEYAPHGTLADVVSDHGMEEIMVGSYARQILLGLNYLHSKGIVHCDVKGQNVLVTKQGAKISDFGCARRVNEDEMKIAGTPLFMAPEAARGEDQGFKADVWALGCTVLELITGKLPWRGVSDPAAMLYKIGFSGEIPEIPSNVSEQGKDFLNKCLKRDPNERWSVGELLGHGFLGEFKVLDWGTPTSVLERGIWDTLEGPTTSTTHCSSSNSESSSPRDRIRSLSGDDHEPVWEWGNDDQWVTVRSNNEEEKLDALSFGNMEDSGSDTVIAFSDREEKVLVIFYEPKIVDAIIDFCCLNSCNCGHCIRELLSISQSIVKFDSHNEKLLPCPVFTFFNSPIDKLNIYCDLHKTVCALHKTVSCPNLVLFMIRACAGYAKLIDLPNLKQF